jgi:hypothetical protein
VPRRRAQRKALSLIPSTLFEVAARALGPASPARLAPMLHDPVFFIGSGRSGTSLLASLLRFSSRALRLSRRSQRPLAPSALPVDEVEPRRCTHLGGRSRIRARVTLESHTRRRRAAACSVRRLSAPDPRTVLRKQEHPNYVHRRPRPRALQPTPAFIHLLRDGALSLSRMPTRKAPRSRRIASCMRDTAWRSRSRS